MKSVIGTVLAISLFLASAPDALAIVNVFACEPEWGSLAQDIGGEKIAVTSATTASQDPHFIRAKPSLIAAVRKADLIICTGASLEVGWLPLLLEKAANPKVLPGTDGNLAASDYVTLLEKPDRLDRADGDVHPEGNPHLHLNPHNIAAVAVELSNRLQRIDPSNSSYFYSRAEDFGKRWSAAISRWERDAVGLRGQMVIVHHKSLTYLLNWLGLKEAGTLEPKPGIPPSSAHLELLLRTMKQNPAALILRTPFDPEDASNWLADKTAIPALVLPYTVGGDDSSSNLFNLFDRTLSLLKGAVAAHAQ